MKESELNTLYKHLVILIISVFVIYSQCRSFDYLDWDDKKYLLQNSNLFNFSFDSIKQIFSLNSTPGEYLYIPLCYLSFMIEFCLFGAKPEISHAINVFFHLANVIMLYFFFRKLTGKDLPSLLATILFAIHPMQVESVAWVMSRKELLSTLFGLGSMLCFLHYCRKEEDGKRNARLMQLLAGTVVLFIAAILSKPSLLILPGVFLLIYLWEEKKLKAKETLLFLLFLPFVILAFVVNSGDYSAMGWQAKLHFSQYSGQLIYEITGRL
ncbi:MAG: glycosyltransferase family 39 protein, partial [Lentisphaeria bacterium]|nr:glycosyltransferase family 39 protein [Lentisphaeria bacterium]NQZ70164.1 glycosyltransferase family 39 protein [Lentisphaeria bacterium]